MTAIGAYLSNQQAKKQQRAANDAYAREKQFLAQNQAYLAPYSQAGQSALAPLMALISGQNQQGEQLSPEQRMSYFQQSPGYQFRLQQGQEALNRLASARGRLFSSAQDRVTQNYAQGLASEEYGNFLNQLSGLSNMGYNAASSQANMGANAAPRLGNLAYQGSFNPFDKGKAFDSILGSAFETGMGGIGKQQMPDYSNYLFGFQNNLSGFQNNNQGGAY